MPIQTYKIADVINSNINQDWLVPSMQREFVWKRKESKIEKLFDSILQGYPFGTILTWQISNNEIQAIECYEFVRHFNEDADNTPLPQVNQYNTYQLILDGQQRLSALNIGINGSYTHSHYNNTTTRFLYLNALSSPEDQLDDPYGLKYEFSFFEQGNTPEADENNFWVKVSSVLSVYNNDVPSDEKKEAYQDKYREQINEINTTDDKKKKGIRKISRLYECLCEKELLNVEIYKGNDHEMVLNIFIRTNDGGMKLEKSDLLLSYMGSHNGLFLPDGARNEVKKLVKNLNAVALHKPAYNFTKDDILKASLALTDLEIRYKVSNFNKSNLTAISNNWEQITKFLSIALDIISKYGFSASTLTSKNALIPIAFKLLYDRKDRVIVSSNTDSDISYKNSAIKWLAISLLSKLFGGSSDTTITQARKQIKENKSFEEITKVLRGDEITKDDISDWVDNLNYNSKDTHLLLMLVTDQTYWNECHVDHIFPISKFNQEAYTGLNLSSEQIFTYEKYANSILNLQLLSPLTNISKSNDDFINWQSDQNKQYIKSLAIPENIPYSFKDFENFLNKRKQLIVNKLANVLITQQ